MDRTTIKRTILLALIIVIGILYRVQFKYPHHPDHYVLGSYTYALIQIGYAPWVLHPASLFGYYPLSIPSAFEYFFSVLSLITGVDINILFFYTSILFGLFAGLGLYLFVRKWTSFEVSLTTSFVLLTMTFFSLDTSYTASTRIFNIIFYPLFILS